MMTLDAKWLEILKAAGGKTTAVAVASGLFLLIASWGWIPALDAWVLQLVTFIFLLTGALAIGSIVSAANDFLRPRAWLLHWWNLQKDKRGLREYIPYMTESEREVISYLLAKNQKTFEAAADGGRAATLLSRGIVIIVARNKQHLDMDNVPMTIPDHLWDVLVEHREQFAYRPPSNGELEGHPWRRHWME